MRPAKADDATNALFFMDLQEIFTMENLYAAFYESAKISHWKESTQRYQADLLRNLRGLQADLLSGAYKVSPATSFRICERGKARDIEAPAIRDRIVQKVLCKKVLVPQLTKYLIYDNYASLTGRGTSFARKRIDILLRRYVREHGTEGYVLKLDIKRFFDSIDHTVLKQMLSAKLDAPREVLDLVFYCIDTSSKTDRGLSLGAEAPQILAIFYLSGFDNYVKSVRGFKYYGHYMDDMLFISDSKEELKGVLRDCVDQLARLGLEVNEKKTILTTLQHGFTFMQTKYSLVGDKIIKRPTRAKIARERRRLKKFKRLYDAGTMSELEARGCYKSWRNNLVKDCSACYRSVRSMDALYGSLFPSGEIRAEPSRRAIVAKALKDYESVGG